MDYINRKTGGKTTGKISLFDHLLNLFRRKIGARAAYPAEWFHFDHCAHGPDVSKWQGEIDWSKLISKSDLAVVRAGYGTSYDPQWIRNRQYLRGANSLVRGLYWYYNTGATAEQQINIINEALAYFKTGEIEMVALDIEKSYNNYTSSTFRTEPLKILKALRNAHPKLLVLQYWNMDVFQNYLNASLEYLQFPVWYAWYPYKPLTTAYPALPRNVSMENIFMWQYWADGNGKGPEYGAQSSAIDLNRTRETKAVVFSKLKQEEPPPDPDPEPEPEPIGCCGFLDAIAKIVDDWREGWHLPK